MVERLEETPQLPKDGEVLEDVACGGCREKGNVVVRIILRDADSRVQFICDPDRTNGNGKTGCGMSITRLVKDVVEHRLRLGLYVEAEMEGAYKKDLGTPHHPR